MLCVCDSTHPPRSEMYTLSLHDALPICNPGIACADRVPAVILVLRDGLERVYEVWLLVVNLFFSCCACQSPAAQLLARSEEHTSELQTRFDIVCLLLLEKKKQRSTLESP